MDNRINCKNLSLSYALDDVRKSGVTFVVESSEVSSIITSLCIELQPYTLISLGVQTGEEYQAIRALCSSTETIVNYVINDLENMKERTL